MKFKLSWHHFLIVVLVVILLGCLVNYLEKNNIIEGIDDTTTAKATTDPTTDPTADPTADHTTEATHDPNAKTNHKKGGKHGIMIDSNNKDNILNKNDNILKNDNIYIVNEKGGSSNKAESSAALNGGSSPKTNDAEGFTNLSGENYDLNPLSPYKNYSCGPVNIDNFFGDIQFKPECCGNPAGSSYSNSTGCACICPDQWNYLNSRGGNNVG